MKYTRRSFKAAGFLTPVLALALTLALTLVSLSACGNNPFVDKILGDTGEVPYGVFLTSQVGRYPNNMHELAPYINENRNEAHTRDTLIYATFLGNDFNEIRKVFIGENGVVEDYSFLSLDMRLMEDFSVPEVPADCFNGADFENVKIVEAWLPETVYTLGERSFANNTDLAVISMPGVDEIMGEAAEFAFINTTSLNEFFLLNPLEVACKGVFTLIPGTSPKIHVPPLPSQPSDNNERERIVGQFFTNKGLYSEKDNIIPTINGYSINEYTHPDLNELDELEYDTSE